MKEKSRAQQLVDVLYWFSYVFVPFCLVLAFNGALDDRTVSTHPASNAVIKGITHLKGRTPTTVVSIRYEITARPGMFCNVDVPVVTGQDRFAVGDNLRIVQTTPNCEVPLLPDHLASAMTALVMAAGYAIFGLLLGIYRHRRDRRLRDEAYRSG